LNLLAIESSASAASVALAKDGALVAQYFQNNGQTHSRTVLPMIESMLENCEWTLNDVDAVAVAAGPGSFTGLRIGISIAKGLAWQGDKLCCGVSTLEAMAHLLSHMEGAVICPVMDARRGQVYNALFEAKGGGLLRLCEDRAIGLSQLLCELKSIKKKKILVGDGAHLCYTDAEKQEETLYLPPAHLRIQSAWGVACAGMALAEAGRLVAPSALQPSYLRLSQAERERQEREQPQKTDQQRGF
jgi:tRNA threonylcarbamoyladenosine biosynthesis protein TsaB